MQDQELFRLLHSYRSAGLAAALVTIVESRGSTPRSAGAKMFLLPNGQSFGTIGGGCVEARIYQKALDVLETKKNIVITSYLNDTVGVADGDICGGTIVVLIEYLKTKNE